MKICFLTESQLTPQDTPGTYFFLQQIVNFVDALIVSPAIHEKPFFSPPGELPWIPVESISTDKGRNETLSALQHFNPDIFYVFSFPEWPECINFLKTRFPAKKIILDINIPLFTDDKNRIKIQKSGKRAVNSVDVITSLSSEIVQTWIPGNEKSVCEYPPIIDTSHFPKPDDLPKKSEIRHFVHIGSFNHEKSVNELIEGFLNVSNELAIPIQLDLYGWGTQQNRLQKEETSTRAYGRINFIEYLSHRKLLTKLSTYDAGIVWEPVELHTHTPSRKILEYMTAGLPQLATDTIAHKNLSKKISSIFLFDNNRKSFENALKEILLKNKVISSDTISKSLAFAENFDFHNVVSNYFVPIFEKLSLSLNITNLNSSSEKCFPNLASYPEKKRKKSLKILLCCNSMAGGKGGTERVAMETAIEMGNRGHIVYIAYADRGHPAYERSQGVVLLPYKSLPNLSEYIKAIAPDVFFVFYFNRMLIHFYNLIHGTGIPFGMQECTNPERLITNNWGKGQKNNLSIPIRCWERELIGAGAHRIRLTMPLYARSFASYVQTSIRAFPNPAFPQQQVANPGDSHVAQKVIINVGGMKANKNFITLIKAFAPLVQDYPDWVIKVFGQTAEGTEPHKVEIREFIKTNHLENKVLICGPTDDIFSEYAASHIHVIASLSEGCPTCVLEAMATGLPSIGFADCPGTNGLIRDSQNGLLVCPEDRENNLTNAMEQLMHSADLREKLGRQALKDSKPFSPHTIYDQWESLFYEAAEYKNDPERLFREQMTIDPERAMHARRMRERLLMQLKG